MMITALLIPAVVAGFLVQVDDEAVALAKARAFREFAATAAGTYFGNYVPIFEVKGTDHTSENYHFDFEDGGVVLRRSDHLVEGFSFHPAGRGNPPADWHSGNEIGNPAAISLGERYIVASGCSQPFEFKEVLKATDSVGNPTYFLAYLPTYKGIIFAPDHKINVEIDYDTGRLTGLRRNPNLPNPPASLQCSVSLETALHNFAAYVYSTYGVSNIHMGLSELVILNPKGDPTDPQNRNLPQHVLDLFGTNDSTLAYLFLANQPSMGESFKSVVSAFGGYVDPTSGRVWIVNRSFPFGGGEAAPLRWDLGIGAITVSNGRQSIEVKDADVDQASAPKKFTPTAKLVLRRAKVVVMIEYDRSSGLIRTTLGEAHSYGKPSENLKKALDKLTN